MIETFKLTELSYLRKTAVKDTEKCFIKENNMILTYFWCFLVFEGISFQLYKTVVILCWSTACLNGKVGRQNKTGHFFRNNASTEERSEEKKRLPIMLVYVLIERYGRACEH